MDHTRSKTLKASDNLAIDTPPMRSAGRRVELSPGRWRSVDDRHIIRSCQQAIVRCEPMNRIRGHQHSSSDKPSELVAWPRTPGPVGYLFHRYREKTPEAAPKGLAVERGERLGYQDSRPSPPVQRTSAMTRGRDPAPTGVSGRETHLSVGSRSAAERSREGGHQERFRRPPGT